ncbi:MAG TPA: hypothetical protein VFO65_11885 [Acidimicrobiales bacterium]|nr:hypothetical protein [Acidimicrobiales bacterium]
MADDPDKDHQAASTVKEAVGGVKEAVGWATGDRRVEAEGEVEMEEAAVDDPAGVEDVEEAEERVRRDHGDIST